MILFVRVTSLEHGFFIKGVPYQLESNRQPVMIKAARYGEPW